MRNIIIIFIIISCIACSRKETEIPEGTIDTKTFTEMMTELHIAQSQLSTKARIKDSTQVTPDPLDLILKKHKISKEKFLSSLKFYSSEPERLDIIYDSVIAHLDTLQR